MKKITLWRICDSLVTLVIVAGMYSITNGNLWALAILFVFGIYNFIESRFRLDLIANENN